MAAPPSRQSLFFRLYEVPHHFSNLFFQLFLRRAGFAVFSFFFARQRLPFSVFSSPGKDCRFRLFLRRATIAVFSFFFTGQSCLRFFTTTLPSSIYDWVCTFAAFLRLLFFHVALRSFSRRRSRRLFFFVFLLYRRNSFPFVPSVLSPTLPDPVCSRGGICLTPLSVSVLQPLLEKLSASPPYRSPFDQGRPLPSVF